MLFLRSLVYDTMSAGFRVGIYTYICMHIYIYIQVA